MTEKTKLVFDCLRRHPEGYTAQDVAFETGLTSQAVNLIFNNFVRLKKGIRKKVKMEFATGEIKELNMLVLEDMEKTKDG